MKKLLLLVPILLATIFANAQFPCGNDTTPGCDPSGCWDCDPSKEYLADSVYATAPFSFGKQVAINKKFGNPSGISLLINGTAAMGPVMFPQYTTTARSTFSVTHSFSPVQRGSLIYNTTISAFEYWNGSAWAEVGSIPTWQNTLIVSGGSTLTQNNTIDAANFNFTLANVKNGSLKSGTGGGRFDWDTTGNSTIGIDGSALRAGVSKQFGGVSIIGNATPSTGAALYIWDSNKLAQFNAAKVHIPGTPIKNTGVTYLYYSDGDTIKKVHKDSLGLVNIYNANGKLTGNRVVDGDGRNITFKKNTLFTIDSTGDIVMLADTSIYMFAKDFIQIESDIIALQTANVRNNTATNGQVLTLIDAANGIVEYADAGGGSDTTIYILGGNCFTDTTILVDSSILLYAGTNNVMLLPDLPDSQYYIFSALEIEIIGTTGYTTGAPQTALCLGIGDTMVGTGIGQTSNSVFRILSATLGQDSGFYTFGLNSGNSIRYKGKGLVIGTSDGTDLTGGDVSYKMHFHYQIADSNGIIICKEGGGGSGGEVSITGRYLADTTDFIEGTEFTRDSANVIRVGNTVTVSGAISELSTDNAGSILLSLPYASDLTNITDLTGTLNGNQAVTGMYIIGDPTTDKAKFNLGNSGLFDILLTYTFTYQIK